MKRRPLHRACLHHAIVFASSLHHLAGLVDRRRHRLLDEHIFARLARFDSHVRVPVIRRRDANRVDGFVVQNLAEVANRTSRTARLILRHIDCGIQIAIVNIAHSSGDGVRLAHRPAQIIAPHLAHADERDRNAIVRAAHIASENLSGQRRGSGLNESPAIVVHAV